MLLTNEDLFQRMPKTRNLSYCCFVNNIRYVILTLLIICCSILFANVILYSVAVLYDDFQGTQLWRQTHWKQSSSTRKRRLLRSTFFEDDIFNSSALAGHVIEALNAEDFNDTTPALHRADNSTQTSVSSFVHEVVNEEETTTIRLLSAMDDANHLVNESSEKPSYKSALHPDKDDDDGKSLKKWDDVSKDREHEKSKEQVKIEGISHKTLKERIQHFMVWTAPGIGMFCGSFPAAWLLRSFGGRRFFAIVLMASAIATALLAMVPHWKYGRYLTAFMRLVQGLALASAFPMIGFITANWGTLKHQFLFLISCTLFIQLAPLVSWSVSTAIFAHDYRTPFLVHAALTCLLALIWLIVFREKPQYHSLVNGLELNKIVAGKIKAEHNRILTENTCRLLITSFSVWAIWIAAFGYFLVISLAVQFLPIYCLLIVRETPSDSALLAVVPFVFMFLMTLLHGLWHRVAKLCNERTSVLAFNTVSFVICSLIFIFLAVFPPGGTFLYSVAGPFTLILCIVTFSIYGFYRSAILVGRFFGQYIVSYIQFFAGFAFFFTAAAAVFFVEENSADEWRVIFLLLAALLLISAAVFGVFGSAVPEEWSKDSWEPSAARPMITFDQIDFHADECGVLEMRVLR